MWSSAVTFYTLLSYSSISADDIKRSSCSSGDTDWNQHSIGLNIKHWLRSFEDVKTTEKNCIVGDDTDRPRPSGSKFYIYTEVNRVSLHV